MSFVVYVHVLARANLRALMTQKSCAVGMRNAKQGNDLKLASSVRALLKPYGDTLNCILECDWLIVLSDNKLSNNKLSNNKLSDNNLASELVENRTFLNQSQARKL